MPARTVSRGSCAATRCRYLRECDPLTGEVIRASKTTAVRYERDRPGELVHMDVKKVGKIPDGGGWRAHGRQMGSTRRARRPGSATTTCTPLVDDHSRLAYSEILPDEKGPTCAGVPAPGRRLLRRPRHRPDRAGDDRQPLQLPQLQRRRSDHRRASAPGTCSSSPHCPWQNGKVERFNRTLQIEWAYRQVFPSNDDRSAALAPWLEHYNTERRHTALGGLPPISRLSPT